MSEFTVGTLFLSRDRTAVQTALQTVGLAHLIMEVNADWSVFLTADEWLFLPETQAAVRAISEAAPLLHFSSAADHGWTFRLFQGGQERAAFSEHYPWDPLIDLLVGEEDPHELPAAPGPERLVYFRLFDLSPEAVDQLGALLCEPPLPHPTTNSRADRFRHLLGVGTANWPSYRTIAREGTAG